MATLREYLLDDEMPDGGPGGSVDWGDVGGSLQDQADLAAALDAKQPNLVSGTHVKTINGSSIVGAGNLTIETGGADGVQDYALEFVAEVERIPGSANYNAHNAFFGEFFPPSTMLGDCWWEFIFMSAPENTQGVICDISHGGNHPVLLESLGDETGQTLYGNLYDGTMPLTEASGKDIFAPDTIHHGVYAVFGQYLYVYLDGVMGAKTQFDGTRQTGILDTDGYLYLGASGEHQQFIGRILRARAFESEANGGFGLPFASAPGAFVPERVFGDVWNEVACVWNVDLTRPSKKIIDTSGGIDGKPHSGFRSLSLGSQSWPEEHLPQFVPTPFVLPTYTGTPAAVPAGADIFDDFSDDNRTHFANYDATFTYSYPSIAQGRTARVGGTWVGDVMTHPPIGILEGHAVPLGGDPNAYQIARMPTPGSATDYTIEVDTGYRGGCAVIVRWQDSDNYLMALLEPTGISFKEVLAGVQTFSSTTAVSNPDWTTATVETVGDTTTVTIGANVATHTEAALASGTTVGFGLAPLQRLKSIAVYEL
jgi:hypothetical protein